MNSLRLELTVGPDHPLAPAIVGQWVTMTLCGEQFAAQVIYTSEDTRILDVPDIEGRLGALLAIDPS